MKTSSVNHSVNQKDLDSNAANANTDKTNLKPKYSNRNKEQEEKDKARKDA